MTTRNDGAFRACRKRQGHGEGNKMLKIAGTNSATPLESVKVSKNELKTNWFSACKRSRKMAFGCQVPGFRCQVARAIVQTNCKANHTQPKKTEEGLKTQKDVKNRGNELSNPFGINKSVKNELKTNWFFAYKRSRKMAFVCQEWSF